MLAGAKEYETITGAFMGSMIILVKMPIGLFQLAQFVKWKHIFPADSDFFFSLMVILSNKDGKTLVLNQF